MYSKDNPSPKYLENLEMYKQMHIDGEKNLNIKAEDTFNGQSLFPQLERINGLRVRTNAKSLLDYGSGKGLLWQENIRLDVKNVGSLTTKEFLKLDEVKCYDPAFKPFSEYPTQSYDGVICIDVLEHIPEFDIFWFVGELFKFSDKFVYANIACYPAKKHLPNGENAHCTIKDSDWWVDIFKQHSSSKPNIKWEIWVQFVVNEVIKEQRVANF